MTSYPAHQCPNQGCSQTTGLLEILATASGSSPNDHEIGFTCENCGQESSIWVWEGKVRLTPQGSATELPALHVYVDPTYGIDCVLQGRLYHMPKRRDAV